MLCASLTVRFAILERFQFCFRRLLQYVTSRFKKDVRWLGKRFQPQKANSLEPESAAQNNSPGLRTTGGRDGGSTSRALGGRGDVVGNANRNQAVGGVTASGAKTFQSSLGARRAYVVWPAVHRGDQLGRASAVQLPEDLNWKRWEVQGSGQTWQASAW